MMSGEGSYAFQGTAERRRHQRIYVALVSPRRFRAKLAGVAGGDDLPVYDLSLGGFSCRRPGELPIDRFPFALEMEGDSRPITGEAEVRTVISDGRIGCEIVTMSETDRERLTGWLIDYILANARVRLSKEEACAIVTGNSFI